MATSCQTRAYLCLAVSALLLVQLSHQTIQRPREQKTWTEDTKDTDVPSKKSKPRFDSIKSASTRLSTEVGHPRNQSTEAAHPRNRRFLSGFGEFLGRLAGYGMRAWKAGGKVAYLGANFGLTVACHSMIITALANCGSIRVGYCSQLQELDQLENDLEAANKTIHEQKIILQDMRTSLWTMNSQLYKVEGLLIDLDYIARHQRVDCRRPHPTTAVTDLGTMPKLEGLNPDSWVPASPQWHEYLVQAFQFVMFSAFESYQLRSEIKRIRVEMKSMPPKRRGFVRWMENKFYQRTLKKVGLDACWGPADFDKIERNIRRVELATRAFQGVMNAFQTGYSIYCIVGQDGQSRERYNTYIEQKTRLQNMKAKFAEYGDKVLDAYDEIDRNHTRALADTRNLTEAFDFALKKAGENSGLGSSQLREKRARLSPIIEEMKQFGDSNANRRLDALKPVLEKWGQLLEDVGRVIKDKRRKVEEGLLMKGAVMQMIRYGFRRKLSVAEIIKELEYDDIKATQSEICQKMAIYVKSPRSRIRNPPSSYQECGQLSQYINRLPVCQD